jgi:RNA polymerase sigma-70 factor, ECF subfamily
MTHPDESTCLADARAGQQHAFELLTEPYRRELLVHCYRLLGSLEDAEDVLQETLLRAWRRLDSFEGRSSLRAWLYKIATNASLDALDSRRVRGLPTTTHPAADPHDPFPAPTREPIWLEPLPDALIDERETYNPEARYDSHESVTLAFLAALQSLPGRQRAVLILKDVLGWNVSEAAETLDMTEAAVNSALQRARATMHQPQEGARRAPARVNNPHTATLLARYVTAWERADTPALIATLREDVVLTMPPLPTWYQGHEALQFFFNNMLFAGEAAGRFKLLATAANGAPAFAVYMRDAEGAYRPSALHVLTIENDQITVIDDFLTFDNQLFSRFGLPLLG